MENLSYSKSTTNSPLCISNIPERPEKFIAFALRHKAIELGLDIDASGFVNVNELISLPHAKKFHFTIEMIKEFVKKDKKKRYELIDRPPLFIRAVQGHSIRKVSEDDSLNQIGNIFLYPIVVHGTYHNAWEFIKNTGLNRMSRNDIHFSIGYPDDDYVLSGMKNDTEVIIELNAPLAITNDIKIYISSNRVILSPGIDGVIPVCYFKKVTDCTTGKLLLSQQYKALILIEKGKVCVIFNKEIFNFADNFSLLNDKDYNSVSSELINVLHIAKVPFVVCIRRKEEGVFCANVESFVENGKLIHPGFFIDYQVIDDNVVNVSELVLDASNTKRVNVDYKKYYDELTEIKSIEKPMKDRRYSHPPIEPERKALSIHYNKRLFYIFNDDICIDISYQNESMFTIKLNYSNKLTEKESKIEYAFSPNITESENINNFKREIESTISSNYVNVYISKESYALLMKLFVRNKIIPPMFLGDRSRLEMNRTIVDRKIEEKNM